MKKIIVLLLMVCFIMFNVSCKKEKNKELDITDVYAQIVLSNGDHINLKLEYEKAPKTVENFVKIARSGLLNDTFFHRIIDNFMIQGGGYKIEENTIIEADETESIKGEFKENGWDKNDIKHELGVISMARSNDPDSATSQFFICSATSPHLDGDYAAFGKTTDEKSNQVILKIASIQTYMLDYMFQNFPVEIIYIKEIKLANEVFE